MEMINSNKLFGPCGYEILYNKMSLTFSPFFTGVWRVKLQLDVIRNIRKNYLIRYTVAHQNTVKITLYGIPLPLRTL
jgi:hypothetical protein